MEPCRLQPGLLPTFRLFIVLSAAASALAWHQVSPAFDVRVSPEVYLFSAASLAFLLLYSFSSRLRQTLGRAFLPLALLVKALHPVVGSYLALSLFVPGAAREYFVLTIMVRLLVNSECIVIFTAWQYSLAWPLIVGAAQCVISAALAWPYIHAGEPLYPLYLSIVAMQIITVPATGLVVGLLTRAQRRQEQALDERNRKLAQYASAAEQLAITQERNRLARELHDTLAHSLSATAIQIEAAQALAENDEAAGRKMLARALQTTRDGLTEARRSLRALRASPVEDLGLPQAVRDLAESLAERAGFTLHLRIDTTPENLGPDAQQCVYRVAQEALSNAARHAAAGCVEVALATENGRVRLSVIDDGRGFDPAAVADTRYGLRGLRERAEMIGGELLVESTKDKGTKVALEMSAG
jgi:signal transduction histidine kinase